MIVRLPFGQGTIPVDLRGFRVRALQPRGPRALANPGQMVLAAVDSPLSGPPLKELAQASGDVVIVVPDGTRAAQIPKILPKLSQALSSWGIPPQRQTVVLACGTHPPTASEDLVFIIGDLDPGIEVCQHDSRDPQQLTVAGRLGNGQVIRLHRKVVEAGLLITIGSVRHHYFAGFGGGPKMVFPGVAGYEEIQTNHGRVFDLSGAKPVRHAGCEPGRLDGNPVAEEIAEAADLRPPDVSVCLVPGIDGGVAEVYAGGWREAFGEAVSRVKALFEVPDEVFDLVVASGGGAPSDETLIQAHKGLDAACRFARPGAEVLYLASMTAGAGAAAMLPFLDDPRPNVLVEKLAAGWVQYGHTTYRLVEKTARYRINLVTAAGWRELDGLGFERAATADEVIERWRQEFAGANVAVITGSAVYPAASSSGS